MKLERQEEPMQPEERPLTSTLTVRGALLALVAFLASIFAKHLPAELASPATQQLLVDLLLALAGVGATVSAYGARRAMSALLVACVLLGGCAGPDLRPTLRATRQTLGALRADYTHGRIVIAGARPETLEALRKGRIEEIDATDKALEAAERTQ